ncbi:hypothetical protein [Frisingicoccus sp.]|uniref:hypothetical protein n=1 Tax=Frisingicoccus sp. TaxID=1918627 RepID=UPI003AB16BBE
MTDYKVKITPELDSGKLEKQLKNLTKDRTMKIKIDTSGLEKAARLADKLNIKLTSASGPKAPKLSDYSQTVKDINALIDAQNRLQNAMNRTGNISPPSIYSPSGADLNRIHEARKAYEELSAAVQKYAETSAAGSANSTAAHMTTGNAHTNTAESNNAFKTILHTGTTALNEATKAIALKNNLKTLKKEITTNLD